MRCRWVEYANIHDPDPTMIQPEWHGWMHHVFDHTPGEKAIGVGVIAIIIHGQATMWAKPTPYTQQLNTILVNTGTAKAMCV